MKKLWPPEEGHALKWQLAYFDPKVGYFGHIN